MKVLGSFVDCVYESHLYKEDVGDIGEVGIIDYNKINNGLQVGSSLQAIIGFIL